MHSFHALCSLLPGVLGTAGTPVCPRIPGTPGTPRVLGTSGTPCIPRRGPRYPVHPVSPIPAQVSQMSPCTPAPRESGMQEKPGSVFSKHPRSSGADSPGSFPAGSRDAAVPAGRGAVGQGRHIQGFNKLPSPPSRGECPLSQSLHHPCRERMRLDLLDPTWFSAESKPRLRESGSG